MDKKLGPHSQHERATAIVRAFLKRRGVTFTEPEGRKNGHCCCDLVVTLPDGDTLRVAIRAATMKDFKNRVVRGRRRYNYTYRAARFSLHQCRLRHRGGKYADIVICCILDERSGTRRQAYILPWRKVMDRLSLFISEPRHGIGLIPWYETYREQWGPLMA